MSTAISQQDFILDYYKNRPNIPIPHAEVVDWATKEWKEQTGKVLRDPDRAVRRIHQQGRLVKVSKGVYKYDPIHTLRNDLFDFRESQKQEILKRDKYRCVVCGRGKSEGVDLQIDHVKPKDKGGLATIENGQTLCGQHNFIKKNYSQTEAGKRFFIKMREQAVAVNDANMKKFCDEVLGLYSKYGYDTQIENN